MSNAVPFITFEGGEGGGKTTQIKLLADWLREQGKDVVTTREPGGTEGAETIRALLVQGDKNRWDTETDALLHLAARRQNLVHNVWPALETGKWVLCDRFMDSTYAYQCFGRGLDRAKVKQVYRLIAGDFAPDLTFFLDLDVKTGLERAAHGKGRNLQENRYEGFDVSFHEKLREGYKTMAFEEPTRFVTVDASQDVDGVQKQIRDAVKARFLS